MCPSRRSMDSSFGNVYSLVGHGGLAPDRELITFDRFVGTSSRNGQDGGVEALQARGTEGIQEKVKRMVVTVVRAGLLEDETARGSYRVRCLNTSNVVCEALWEQHSNVDLRVYSPSQFRPGLSLEVPCRQA